MKMSDLRAERAPMPEHVEVLRERAAELARPAERYGAHSADASIIFELGGERYAVAAGIVLQIAVLSELTPLPGAKPPLYGITQWRGGVLTVLDLRAALGASQRGLTDLGRVVVIDGPVHDFGILADAVRDVRDIGPADIGPLPGGDDGRSLLRGITADGIFVLDEMSLMDLGRGG